MADAAEAKQLAAVVTAVEQRDVASLARLTRAANIAAVSEAGCLALDEILADDFSPTSEETQLAVEVLVSALRAQPACASCSLRTWCIQVAGARELAGAVGAVEAVLAVLRTHLENAEVMYASCLALGHLFECCPENSGRAHRCGALEAILDTQRAHPMHEGVQVACCLALVHLCDDVEGAPVAAVQLGAPAVISIALQSFPDRSVTQAYACCALAATLPSKPTKHAEDALPVDIVSCVTGVAGALRCHAADAVVQHHALMAARRLLYCKPVGTVELWRQGAFPLLMRFSSCINWTLTSASVAALRRKSCCFAHVIPEQLSGHLRQRQRQLCTSRLQPCAHTLRTQVCNNRAVISWANWPAKHHSWLVWLNKLASWKLWCVWCVLSPTLTLTFPWRLA